jgi:hypothetical protein
MEISVGLVFVISLISKPSESTTDVTWSSDVPRNFTSPPRKAGEGPKAVSVILATASSFVHELKTELPSIKQAIILAVSILLILYLILVFFLVCLLPVTGADKFVYNDSLDTTGKLHDRFSI